MAVRVTELLLHSLRTVLSVMKLDVDASLRQFCESCLRHRHDLLVVGFFATMLFIQYCFLAGIYSARRPSALDSAWTNSVVRMIVQLSAYEMFDDVFFAAGEYFAILFFVVWGMVFTTHRVWALNVMQFQHNLLAYRRCVSPLEQIEQQFAEVCSSRWALAFVFRCCYPVLRRQICQFYFLLRNKPLMLDMAQFKSEFSGLCIFSKRVLVRTAVLSDMESFFCNLLSVCFNLLLVGAITMFVLVQQIRNALGLTLIFYIFPSIVEIFLQLFAAAYMHQIIAMSFHMHYVNRLLRHGSRPVRRNLRLFMFWSVVSSRWIAQNVSQVMFYLWVYLWIPINAYAFYRLVFLRGELVFEFITILFFVITGMCLFGSIAVFTVVNKAFHRHRNAFPLIIGRLSGRRTLLIQYKSLVCYEQQISKRFKSGFKIYPNIFINSLQAFKLSLLYVVILLQVLRFFMDKKRSNV